MKDGDRFPAKFILKNPFHSGPPSDTNLYLFNGDIVDKGPMSLECVLYLFLLKLSRPNQVRNSKKKIISHCCFLSRFFSKNASFV